MGKCDASRIDVRYIKRLLINFAVTKLRWNMTDFEKLKEICRVACHERGACTAGYEALMHADSIGAILAVWKANWEDIFSSKFADVMVERISEVYRTAKAEMNAAGFWVNEDREQGMVIITNAPQLINLGGTAKGYVFAPSMVSATDNAQVFCRTDGSDIALHGHATGNISGRCTLNAYDFSTARCTACTCHTHGAAQITMHSGIVVSHGHRYIVAYQATKVYANTRRGIETDDSSTLLPLDNDNQ